MDDVSDDAAAPIAAPDAVPAPRPRRRWPLLAGLVTLALAVVVAVVALGGEEDRPATKASAAGPAIAGAAETKALLEGVPQDGLALGDPKAPVTLIEFIDLQCPFCREHQLEVQPQLVKELVRSGEARIAFVPLAFLGPDSVKARNVLLRLAQRNRAWDFANLFYWNQGHENTGYVTPAFLSGLLAAIPGTSPADASPTLDPAFIDVVRGADALGQQVLGPRESGTPSFAVGKTGENPAGYRWIELHQGAPAAEQLVRAVRDEARRVKGAAQPGATA